MSETGAAPTAPDGATGVLVLADGSVAWGLGFGAEETRIGEVCFNTAMTGYQEVLTDPSYAGQIIVFTFPHIGNVGANPEDMEATNPSVRGLILREGATLPSSYRSAQRLDAWLKTHGIVGLAGVDTRALTVRIREGGFFNAAIAHDPKGQFDIAALRAQVRAWPGLEGMDLAAAVTTAQTYGWEETLWKHGRGFGRLEGEPRHKVVAVDYGIKRNILRCLTSEQCAVTVVPATASAEEILRHRPDGVFLSNGPGDPAATAEYAVPAIDGVMRAGVPIFGICLGHQLLALALGGRTTKMHQGHHGANHPVKDLRTGRVEITSMNHGFTVDADSLPEGVTQTHVSLFDGSNCGLTAPGHKVFSVQYHPEASPGPQDSYYLFRRFVGMMNGEDAQA